MPYSPVIDTQCIPYCYSGILRPVHHNRQFVRIVWIGFSEDSRFLYAALCVSLPSTVAEPNPLRISLVQYI